MNTVQVSLPGQEWHELVGLSQQKQVSPVCVLKQAVRHFLGEKNAWHICVRDYKKLWRLGGSR